MFFQNLLISIKILKRINQIYIFIEFLKQYHQVTRMQKAEVSHNKQSAKLTWDRFYTRIGQYQLNVSNHMSKILLELSHFIPDKKKAKIYQACVQKLGKVESMSEVFNAFQKADYILKSGQKKKITIGDQEIVFEEVKPAPSQKLEELVVNLNYQVTMMRNYIYEKQQSMVTTPSPRKNSVPVMENLLNKVTGVQQALHETRIRLIQKQRDDKYLQKATEKTLDTFISKCMDYYEMSEKVKKEQQILKLQVNFLQEERKSFQVKFEEIDERLLDILKKEQNNHKKSYGKSNIKSNQRLKDRKDLEKSLKSLQEKQKKSSIKVDQNSSDDDETLFPQYRQFLCEYFYTDTPYAESYSFQGNCITYIGKGNWTQILSKVEIPPPSIIRLTHEEVFCFGFRVKRSLKSLIIFGLIDLERKQAKHSHGSGLAVSYYGWSGAIRHAKTVDTYEIQGIGFGIGDVVELLVERQRGWVSWEVNGIQVAGVNAEWIKQDSRILVPYFEFEGRGDMIEILI